MATRRERVVLELDDQFTTSMARAAASAALLNKELDSLSHDSVRTRRSLSDIDSGTLRVGSSAGQSGREIDKLSGRLRLLTDTAAVLGPSLLPIGAVGVPAITGLASQLGFAAAAGGTAILAFQGIGTTLKALNAAALAPTAENLQKAQVALEGLSPQAQAFVAQVGRMIPELHRLRDVAAAGLFPGLTAGLTSLESGLPRVANIISAVSTELGTVAEHAGASLASPKWNDFLDFVAREAPVALGDMATAAGHAAHTVAELWMATAPLNDDFSKWLVQASADIDRWATSLSKTQGFADFVNYIDTTGPKVAAALGAIANAAIQIVQAASPLGGPVLDGIKVLADVVAKLADSDIGTPLFTAAAALALFNRTLAVTSSIQKGSLFGASSSNFKAVSSGIRGVTADLALMNRQALRSPAKGFIGPLTQAQTARGSLAGSLAGIGRATALLGGLAVASTGAADKIGLTNTASLALAGTFIAPGWGTAVGGAVGLMLDASKAGDRFSDSMKRADAALRTTDTTKLSASLKELQKQQDDLSKNGALIPARGQAGAQSAIAATSVKVDELKAKLEFSRGHAQAQFLADGFTATKDGIDGATQSTQDFIDSLQKLSDVLAGRASFRDFEQSLIDFTKRQKDRAKVLADIRQENSDFATSQAGINADIVAAQKKGDKGRVADLQTQRAQAKQAHDQRIKDLTEQGDTLKNSLNTSTQAGIDTQNALDNIAATALKVAQGLDPIKRGEFLAGARAEYVKAAIAAGNSKKAAEDLANTVLGLSAVKGQPKIVIDPSGAYRVIDETARRLERLTRRSYKVNIQAQAGKNLAAIADIHGFAGGGWTGPGTKWQPAGVVHAEEFVVKRGPAAAFRPYLERLNQLPGYADGGMVQRFPAQMAAPVVTAGGEVRLSQDDIKQLSRAMLAARPMFGDQYISPHNYNEFRRQMEESQRAVGIGGVPQW